VQNVIQSIKVMTVELSKVDSSIEVFNSSSFDVVMGPAVSVTIPLEFLQAFDEDQIKVYSALYRNASHLFSQHLANR